MHHQRHWLKSLLVFAYLHAYSISKQHVFVYSWLVSPSSLSLSPIYQSRRRASKTYTKNSKLYSHVEIIKVKNFGGIINGDRQKSKKEDLTIQVANEANLVAVTGETGSGKSLLVAKAMEYIMGCKASPSVIPISGDAYAAIKVGECLVRSWRSIFAYN